MALSAGPRFGHYCITAAVGAAALLIAAPAVGQPVVAPDCLARIGEDFSRYELQYGPPENRSLDDFVEGPEDWPRRQAIRTVGTVVPTLQPPHKDAQKNYVLSGKAFSLQPIPVEEIADAYARHMPSSLGHELEVVGAFEKRVFAPLSGSPGGSSCCKPAWRLVFPCLRPA